MKDIVLMYNIAIMLAVMTFHSCQTYWSCPIRSFQSEVSGRWGIISAWMNHLLKGIPVSPLSELLPLQVNPTEAENQTGKTQLKLWQNVLSYYSHHSVSRFFISSLVWRAGLQEEPDLWIHQLGNLQLHVCSRLLRWQLWRYCAAGPADAHCRQLGR